MFSVFEKGFIVVALLAIGFVFVSSFYEVPETYQVKQFASCEELNNFVASSADYYGIYGELGMPDSLARTTVAGEAEQAAPKASDDFSTTNIQVEGVDEADIVKNDGRYIYLVSGSKIVIVDAYPAEGAEILAELEFKGTPTEIFVNEDKLVVFGIDYGSYYSGNTFIQIYDITDRENPVIVRDITTNGTYFDSRMIGNYVYAIVNQPIYSGTPLPRIAYAGQERAICNCPDVYYFDVPDYSRRFTTVLAINTQDSEEEVSSEVFLMGATQEIYVSLDNIYVTYTKRLNYYDYMDRIIDEAVMPLVSVSVRERINEIRNYDISTNSKWQEISVVIEEYIESLSMEERTNLVKQMQERMQSVYDAIAKDIERTIIHKIAIDNGNIEYKTQGYAPGIALNQFSMDEYNGYFRIATTTSTAESKNHLYVLDSDLNIVGKLEDLAAGERIYSARFIGNKAYMVTFRQIDPLFVIDLEDPYNPSVLGYLKVPGVSDYLHPYDENHLIGIGIDATEEGRMLGMKLSLFDVSDVENPEEISKYIIGERGTSSEALYDHKAFLFSKEKSLLVMPVSLVEDNKWNAFQGAYVFGIDLENGFVLKGSVSHSNATGEEEEYYYYDYLSQVRRSLYIDDVLYTISRSMIKMNSLDDISEIGKLDLPYEEELIVYGIREPMTE